jgi:hypothetical protein
MADVKISGLPASSVPLAGTEVLPIVQGGQTRQVSVNNLTTGKAISATQYTSTIVTGTAPLVVASTTEVANLRSANATSADTANQVKSNATTGVLQVTGPATAATRVMTTPDANFTVARTDAAQTFTGAQTFSGTTGSTVICSGSVQGVLAIKKSNVNGVQLINGGVGVFQIYDADGAKFIAEVDASQNFKLTNGNLVIGTDGKGIDFTATPGTGTSELFADYEEGVFTPVLKGGTTPGTGTYATQVGVYTKVGRAVYYEIQLDWVSHTGTGTYMYIDGFPFASAASPARITASIRPNNIALSANNIITCSIYTGASTFLVLEQMPTGGGATTEMGMDTAGAVIINGFYFV